ncbi:acyltransferase [Chitinivorax sp. PXF-14]|uniref:acyltransferase n=1 Tax=Chitinivorax sp. PXF-14 TaxID=3230488 RepID=UPI003465D0C1
MSILKFFQPKFLFALARSLWIKAKYGRDVRFNLFKVYFGKNFDIRVVGGGTLEIETSNGRVYFDDNCRVMCSGGKLRIQSGTFFNTGCIINVHEQVDIGADCMFGPSVALFDSDHAYSERNKKFKDQGYIKAKVVIGENCWVGANTVITKGVKIESNVIVGANSVVTKPLASRSIYAGNPARLIKNIWADDGDNRLST